MLNADPEKPQAYGAVQVRRTTAACMGCANTCLAAFVASTMHNVKQYVPLVDVGQLLQLWSQWL